MPIQRSRVEVELGNENLKTVRTLVPVDIFLAADIVDGAGKKTNRLVLRAKGDRQWYFLFTENQQVEANMRTVAPWLQDVLDSRMPADGAINPGQVKVKVGSPKKE